MLPVYFIYLAGSAESDIGLGQQKKNILVVNSIGFVLGFTLVFVVLGASATALGHFLDNHRDILRKISGVVMILFGLYFMGIFKLGFLEMTKRFDFRVNKKQFPGSILFGMVFGFGWTPCLGAFLGSALVLAGNSEKLLEGITLLLVYSIGLGLPFIISAVIFDRARIMIKKIQTYNRLISIISGLLLIIAGVLVFTDRIKGGWI